MRYESSYAPINRRGSSACLVFVLVVFTLLIAALTFGLYTASTPRWRDGDPPLNANGLNSGGVAR